MRYFIISIRLQQWIKNLFIFAALIFSGHLIYLNDVLITILGFILFSFVSSGIYIFNDIADIERDKLHPIKSQRPISSGKLSLSTAYITSSVLSFFGMLGGFILQWQFGVILLFYFLINIVYSLKLKNIVILDVMTIAAGFVLRVVGGAVLINVVPSEWLVICTILLSLFLGFSKRRHELSLLEEQANVHRSVLQHYSSPFLDQMIGIVTASTVMSYTLYTISEETIKKFDTKNLVLTVPFVLYGIFRYLYLIHRKYEGGNPTKIALTDRPLLINILLWIITIILIIYGKY